MRTMIDKLFLLITKTIMRCYCFVKTIWRLCNDTVITSANKFRNFQCKVANVTIAMTDIYEQNIYNRYLKIID